MKSKSSKALILLSGGQDSTTCLIWAKKKFAKVYAISFDYGQRHKIEIKAAQKVAKKTNTHLRIQKINFFKEFSKNALTHNIKITAGGKKQLPSTFVPGRNLIFLSVAAIYAKQLGVTDIITGVCQTDYSGYPDCRNDFVKSLEKTLRLAMNHPFKIHTPLMWFTKGQTVKLMKRMERIDLYKYSHTCYEGGKTPCGKCPACKLRAKGFKEAKIKDPLLSNSSDIS